ncbi:MAG: serine/threonine-protein kinase [Planctomycetota bacterium]|nr:serine/threonine-protein kinase [Planctomycetota bacterium]
MPFATACPRCQKQVRVIRSHAEQRGRCPHCQEPFQVPGFRQFKPIPSSKAMPVFEADDLNQGDGVAEKTMKFATQVYAEARTQKRRRGMDEQTMKLHGHPLSSAQIPAFSSELLASASETPIISPPLDPREAVRNDLRKILAKDPFFSPSCEIIHKRLEKLHGSSKEALYRVLDRRLGRESLLKLYRPNGDAEDERSIQLFLREARMTSRLGHPAVPAILDAGTTTDGEYFLRMGHIRGQSLEQRLRRYHREGRDPIELSRLLEALARVGECLAYAHSVGLVHRNLKPTNIMLGHFGEVLVNEWGLAKDLRSEERAPSDMLDAGASFSADEIDFVKLTEPKGLLGTPGYISPEQAQDRALDGRADVFALGALLTEILTNAPPFAGDNDSFLEQTISGQTVLPKDRVAEVAPELNALARESLRSDPKDRLVSAGAFVDELRSFLRGDEMEVYRYSAYEQVLRTVGRSPEWLLILCLASLVACLLGWII